VGRLGKAQQWGGQSGQRQAKRTAAQQWGGQGGQGAAMGWAGLARRSNGVGRLGKVQGAPEFQAKKNL